MDVPTHQAPPATREGIRHPATAAPVLALLLLAGSSTPVAVAGEVRVRPGADVPRSASAGLVTAAPAQPTLARPDTSAGLLGRVAYTDGRVPVVGALIALPELDRAERTDSVGRFRFEDLPAGRRLIRLELPDGRRTERRLRLAPDTLTRVDFRIPAEVGSLEGIHVLVAARRPDPLSGFRRRRREERGVFLDRSQIEERQPRQVSDLFRRIPGIQVEHGDPAGPGLRMRRFGSRCEPLIYLDGVPAPGLRIDFLMPAELAALEVYRGAAELPLQFGRPTQRCGAIIIWTREGGREP